MVCETSSDTAITGKVKKYDCQDSYDEDWNEIKDTTIVCATSTSESQNFATCVKNDSLNMCNSLNAVEKECGYDSYEDAFEVEYVYKCIQFDNGNKYWIAEEENYCSGLCSNGCVQTACTAGTAAKCSGDVALNCMTSIDGSASQWIAEDCTSYGNGVACEIEEGEAFCE